MFLAHYGVALAAKRVAPQTSLGTTVFAAQFLDLLWPLLLLVGLESVRVVPGLMAASSLDFVHYPISHSLLMAVFWAAVAGGVYYAVRRNRPGGIVVAVLVASHWLLDAPMHRPDLLLWPGSDIRVGGGIWNSLAATLALEFAIFGGGILVYVRRTHAAGRIGSIGLWSMLMLLVVFYLGSLFAPPPADPRSLAVGGLGLWLFVPWAAWVDRRRSASRGRIEGGEEVGIAVVDVPMKV